MKSRFKAFLVPEKVLAWKKQLREKGFRVFVRDMGWKVIVAFILFYFVRDVLLYIIIPYLIARGVLSG